MNITLLQEQFSKISHSILVYFSETHGDNYFFGSLQFLHFLK